MSDVTRGVAMTTTGNARIRMAQAQNDRDVLAYVRRMNLGGETASLSICCLAWHHARERLTARGMLRYAKGAYGYVARGFGLRAGVVVRIAKVGR